MKQIVCMKWGPLYPADYVNKLYGMVRRHTQEEGSREFSGRPLVMGGQNYYAPNFTRFVRGMLE